MTQTTAPVPAHAAPIPIRFLDCLLVVAFLPFALLSGLPAVGIVVGTVAWLAQRALGVYIDHRAQAAKDPKTATAITFTGVMGRPLLLGLTILAAGLVGDKHDGLAAAILVLVAFTVYLILSIILRPQRNSST
jgi:hypothetical protein